MTEPSPGERMARIETGLENLHGQVAQVGVDLRAGFTGVQETLEKHYVRREEFDPVRQLAYGAAGVLLVALLAAMAKLALS